MATIIWATLAALGYLTAHAIGERSIYHLLRQEADPRMLEALLTRWQSSHDIPRAVGPGLGWLGRSLEACYGDPEDLSRHCYHELHQSSRFGGVLEVAAIISTSLGLLGSVVAIYFHATSQAGSTDPRSMLGLGMGTTICGLLIYVPATVAHHFFTQRGDRLAAQVETVLRKLADLRKADAEPSRLNELAQVMQPHL